MNLIRILLVVGLLHASLAQDDETTVKPFIRPYDCNPQILKCPAYFKHWRYNSKTNECTQHYLCLDRLKSYMTTQAKCEKLCIEPVKPNAPNAPYQNQPLDVTEKKK